MDSIQVASELDPLNPESDMLMGMVHESTGNWVEAGESYRAASEKDPDDIEPVLATARVLHANGDPTRAATYLEVELAGRPLDFRLSMAAGEAYLAIGSQYDAITHFSTAADMEPEHAGAREGLSMSLILAGLHTEALDRMHGISPSEMDPMMRLALGRSALLVNQATRSSSLLSSYLNEYQRDGEAWLDLGRAYYLDDKFELALGSLRRCLGLRPQDSSAFTLLGHIRLRMGQKDLAFAAYEHAIVAGGDAILLTELMERAREIPVLEPVEEGEL